jgi:osmotically-inducible protein OsmY
VGIVSRGDLLRLFLRQDQDILAEVRDEVLLKTLWIDPTNLGIEVDRGVVTLTGTLDRRSTLPLVVRMVETVAGVVDVVDHLSYHYDDIRGREERPVLPTVA